MFDDKHEISPKQLWDYYPTLFKSEKMQVAEERAKQEAELYKAKMMDYMHRHNAKIGGGK